MGERGMQGEDPVGGGGGETHVTHRPLWCVMILEKALKKPTKVKWADRSWII